MGVHPATNHHRRPVLLKVLDQVPGLGGQLGAGRNRDEPGLDVAECLKDESDLSAANPLLGANELGLLVADVDEALLDGAVGGDLGVGEALAAQP